MSFKEEPLSAKIYIVTIIFAGLYLLSINIPSKASLGWPLFAFIIVRMLMDHLDVPLPKGNGTVSVSFPIDLAIIIIFGPEVATWASISLLFNRGSIAKFPKLYYKTLFNVAQMVLCVNIASSVYVRLGGNIGAIVSPSDIYMMALAAVVYITSNNLIVMIVITLTEKVSFWGLWLTNFRWAIPNYFAVLPLGFIITAVYTNLGIIGLLLLAIPLVIARHTFLMYVDMRNQYISTIKALTKAIDAKDHYTHGHSERVAEYAVAIAKEMNLPEDYQEKLEYLALMHDIGKIAIPEHILNKPSRLSDEEFALIRSHPSVGAEIIQNIKLIGDHADIVRHHHERVDGRGYPDQLPGEKVSLGAKIVGAADAFDAMTSARVYSKPMSKHQAVAELLRCCNTQFCQEVVGAFIKVLNRRGEI